MPPPYNDRWERTRRHLIRNFVVNPELSPVPEEERSSPSSEGGSLPDLVVEPAPYRHDHPPDFYVGLEYRMKRYYRKLFLGESDDDDRSDYEVNRSMGSTFILDDHTRKDTEANVLTEKNSTDLDNSIVEKRPLTKSTNESHDDKLIDMCETYIDKRHVSDASKSSSIEDEENPILIGFQSTDESNHRNKTDDDINVNIEANGNKQRYAYNDDNQGSTNGDTLNRSGALNETEDVSKRIGTKSDSDEAPCHRVSTTVAEIHERRARDSTHAFDNGSPVLIPRLLQFSRRVFGSRNISSQSFNVSEASGESDDDDRSDYEVNRSMGSTFMLDDHTRKDTEANVLTEKNSTDLDNSIVEKRPLTKSTNERHDDKLIDTCETYIDKRHVSDASKSSSIEDEENPTLIGSQSTDESNHRNKTDDDINVNIEANGNKQRYAYNDDNQGSTNGDTLNRSGALNETEDVSKRIGTTSDSDEAPCHRVSTTVAEIHERRARDSTHAFDNGSPVLIPRLLQFSRRVFGSKKISGQSFNVSEASDEFIRRLSSHKSDVSNKLQEDIQEPETEVERLIADSQLTRASIHFDKTDDTEITVVQYIDNEENDVSKKYDIGDKDLSKIQSDKSHKSDVSNKQQEYIQKPETEVERLIADSQLTRASIHFDKTYDTEITVVQYIDNEEKNQEDDVNINYDIGDKDLSKTQSDNEGSKNGTDVEDETEITGMQNTSIDWNKDGIDDDEDCLDNDIRRAVFRSKARKMNFLAKRSSEESFDDLQPLAHSSANSIDEVEVMRETRGSGVNESWHGEVHQDSPAALAFERRTDADKLENESSDSTKFNASIEEIEEPNTDPHNTPQNIAEIIDEFWSVSPMEVDIEELKENSRGSKRRTDSEGDATAKRKKDVAIQTGLEENNKWEDIRKEFFVGQPLVFRLCSCPDHACS